VFITDHPVSAANIPAPNGSAPTGPTANGPTPNAVPHMLEARTRDRVRRAISEDGPLTAADLASRLGLTPAAVRRHLDLLNE
jgi:DNA-binding transcriptional ArsR family regulator